MATWNTGTLTCTAGSGFTVSIIQPNFEVDLALSTSFNSSLGDGSLPVTLGNTPSGGLWMKANINHRRIPLRDPQPLQKRLQPLVSLQMATPFIHNGVPTSPPYTATNTFTATLQQGAGHMATRDPKSYTPGSGNGQWRWSVDSLTVPTDDYGYSLYNWPTHSSTPSGPVWQAPDPFTPTVMPYHHTKNDGTMVTAPAAVVFSPHYCEHMWLDMGAGNYTMPFTWIAVGIPLPHQGGAYRHFILDSGRDPYAFQGGWTTDNASWDTQLPGTDEGLSYRTTMSYNKHYFYASCDDNNGVRSMHSEASRPHMYWGIWANDIRNAYAGNWTHRVKHTARGTMTNASYTDQSLFRHLDNNAHRYYLLGRENGYVGVEHGAHLALFELRFFTSALSMSAIQEQYDQLSASWKFAQYG